MKKDIDDILFDHKFKDNISRQSIKKHKGLKDKDSALALAMLIAYILKFKRKDMTLSDTKPEDFAEIKLRSLEQFRQYQTKTVPQKRYYRIVAAASILILFTIGGYWFGHNQLFSGYNSNSNIVEFNTPRGQQSELSLPDGTFVALNYGSKLKYHISSNKKLQEVELDGEAFFKVKKKQIPDI